MTARAGRCGAGYRMRRARRTEKAQCAESKALRRGSGGLFAKRPGEKPENRAAGKNASLPAGGGRKCRTLPRRTDGIYRALRTKTQRCPALRFLYLLSFYDCQHDFPHPVENSSDEYFSILLTSGFWGILSNPMRISVDFLLLPVENSVENVENIHFFLYNFCMGKAIFFSFPVFRSCF